MQAETALGRVGLWFLVMLAAMAAALGAADSGFAAHAWIIAALGFVMVWVRKGAGILQASRRSFAV